MTNKLDQIYNELRGRKLCGLEAQCFDGVMIEEVIRHRLGVPKHEHPQIAVSLLHEGSCDLRGVFLLPAAPLFQ
jgi:hypothetical protein